MKLMNQFNRLGTRTRDTVHEPTYAGQPVPQHRLTRDAVTPTIFLKLYSRRRGELNVEIMCSFELLKLVARRVPDQKISDINDQILLGDATREFLRRSDAVENESAMRHHLRRVFFELLLAFPDILERQPCTLNFLLFLLS